MALRRTTIDHPVRRHRNGAFFARRSLPVLLLVLVVLLGVVSLVVAVPFALAAAHHSILFWWWQSLLLVLDDSPPEASAAHGTAIEMAKAVAGFTTILLPGLFLGAIVYKLFLLSDLFQFRKQIAVERKGGRDRLVIRLYNTSTMMVVDVQFRVFLRASRRRATGTVVMNTELTRSHWPVSFPCVPFSLVVSLRPGDIVTSEDGSMLESIQGRRLPPEYKLLVTVKGAVPDMGTAVDELAWFTQGDVDWRAYGDIQVDYNVEPRRWRGWNRFDADG